VHILTEIATAKTAKKKKQSGAVPNSARDLRLQMNAWACDSEEGRKSTYGGFFHGEGEDKVWIDLQHSLKTAFGGQCEIKIFTEMYDVTVHCHAPETSIHVQTFQARDAEAPEYHVLHTLGWESWHEDDEDASKILRSWGGDHWQVIKVNNSIKIPLSQSSGGSASQASSATTALKLEQKSPEWPSRRLDFSKVGDMSKTSGGSASQASAATTALKLEQKSPERPSRRLDFSNVGNTALLVAVNENVPMLAAPKEQKQVKEQRQVLLLKQENFAGRTEVQLMLRAVASEPYVYTLFQIFGTSQII
jgi:hypothetical protein